MIAIGAGQAAHRGGGEIVEVAGQKRHAIGYMKDFLFSPEQARTLVGALTGGECGRLMLELMRKEFGEV